MLVPRWCHRNFLAALWGSPRETRWKKWHDRIGLDIWSIFFDNCFFLKIIFLCFFTLTYGESLRTTTLAFRVHVWFTFSQPSKRQTQVVFHNKHGPREESPFRLHPGLLRLRDSHFIGNLQLESMYWKTISFFSVEDVDGRSKTFNHFLYLDLFATWLKWSSLPYCFSNYPPWNSQLAPGF